PATFAEPGWRSSRTTRRRCGSRSGPGSALRSGSPTTARPTTASSGLASQRGTDECVAGDEGGELVLGEVVGAGWAFGDHQVAAVGVGVPDVDLDVRAQGQAELGEHGAGFADHAGAVGERLVPARGRAEERHRVAR